MSSQLIMIIRDFADKNGVKNRLPKGMTGYGLTFHEGHAYKIAELYAGSQEVKEQHWRELLEAIGENLDGLLRIDFDEAWSSWDQQYGGDEFMYSGLTYDDLYKRLGLKE